MAISKHGEKADRLLLFSGFRKKLEAKNNY